MFFSEARELFEQIVDWLGSDSICGLEHGELESKLLEQGYELLGNDRPLICLKFSHYGVQSQMHER
jgi:hypothetical protein